MGGTSGINIGGKPSDEMKLEDTGAKHPGQTQLTQRQQQTGLSTFRPDQVLRARVNVEEQKDKFIVTADVPGFDKQNLKVNLGDDGMLHIAAEQTKEFIDQAKDKKYLRTERSQNTHKRTHTEAINQQHITLDC